MRTRRTLLAMALGLMAVFPNVARADRQPDPHQLRATITFRLHVTRQPSVGTTFWVAYGPLDGRFTILQLNNTHRVLPLRERTLVTFLTGKGAIHTRYGQEPGPPVTVIWRSMWAPISQVARWIVRWPAAIK
jgi:hypothetical protein